MPQGQNSGDVRRRNDDGIRWTGRGYARRIGGETTLLDPLSVPFVLNCLWFVRLRDFCHIANGQRTGQLPIGQLPRASLLKHLKAYFNSWDDTLTPGLNLLKPNISGV